MGTLRLRLFFDLDQVVFARILSNTHAPCLLRVGGLVNSMNFHSVRA